MARHHRLLVGTIVSLGIALLAVGTGPASSALALAARETLLAELPPDCDRASVVVSPDGRRVAYVRASGEQQVVVLDGAPGKPYAGIAAGTLAFSPDSKRLLYIASRTGKTLRALTGAVQTQRFHVCIMSAGGKVCVVADGKELKEYDGIDTNALVFTPDSQRIAYLGQEAGKWLVVLDEREQGQEFDDLSPYREGPNLVFSPDSRRLAYVGLRREEDKSPLGYRFHWSVVLDGQKGPEYEMVGERTDRFSPDAKHLAYVAVRKGREFVVRDGTEEPESAAVLSGSLCFSPDSGRVGYISARGKNLHPQVAVVGTERGQETFGLLALNFSPDGQRVACMTYKRMPQPDVAIDMAVVVDGKAGKEYAQLQKPVYFSPDSRRVAYVALPPARRSEGKKSVAVVDDAEGAVYSEILPPLVFSPDSRHVAYRAVARDKRAVVVVDGKEAAAYEEFPDGAPFRFADNATLVVVARRGNSLYRAEIDAASP